MVGDTFFSRRWQTRFEGMSPIWTVFYMSFMELKLLSSPDKVGYLKSLYSYILSFLAILKEYFPNLTDLWGPNLKLTVDCWGEFSNDYEGVSYENWSIVFEMGFNLIGELFMVLHGVSIWISKSLNFTWFLGLILPAYGIDNNLSRLFGFLFVLFLLDKSTEVFSIEF